MVPGIQAGDPGPGIRPASAPDTMFRQSPYQSFSERLAELRGAIARKEWLRGQLADVRVRRELLAGQLDQARDRLAGEIEDVERLSGHSLVVWFYRLVGRLDDRLEQERAEVAAAVLVVEETEAELRALDRDTGEMESRLAAIDDVEGAYDRVRAEAMAWVETSGDAGAWKLFEGVERVAGERELRREVQEATHAAARIRTGLNDLRRRILEVSIDVLGADAAAEPDPEVTARLRDLLAVAGEAGNELRAFHKELNDVRLHALAASFDFGEPGVRVDFGATFFSGLVRDWMERGHPNRALQHVDVILDSVEHLAGRLAQLRAWLDRTTDRDG